VHSRAVIDDWLDWVLSSPFGSASSSLTSERMTEAMKHVDGTVAHRVTLCSLYQGLIAEYVYVWFMGCAAALLGKIFLTGNDSECSETLLLKLCACCVDKALLMTVLSIHCSVLALRFLAMHRRFIASLRDRRPDYSGRSGFE